MIWPAMGYDKASTNLYTHVSMGVGCCSVVEACPIFFRRILLSQKTAKFPGKRDWFEQNSWRKGMGEPMNLEHMDPCLLSSGIPSGKRKRKTGGRWGSLGWGSTGNERKPGVAEGKGWEGTLCHFPLGIEREPGGSLSPYMKSLVQVTCKKAGRAKFWRRDIANWFLGFCFGRKGPLFASSV